MKILRCLLINRSLIWKGISWEVVVSEELKKLNVSDLIYNGMWELDRIENMLSMEELSCIKCIIVPEILTADRMIWLGSRDGKYSVKMGYKSAKEKIEVEGRENPGTSYMPSKKLWNGIWNIKMPPKVLQVMGRAVNDAIATR